MPIKIFPCTARRAVGVVLVAGERGFCLARSVGRERMKGKFFFVLGKRILKRFRVVCVCARSHAPESLTRKNSFSVVLCEFGLHVLRKGRAIEKCAKSGLNP